MSDNRVINHKLHIILTLFTSGAWLSFYGPLFIIFKLSGSTIETRRIKRATRRIKRAKTKEDRRITQKLVQESARKGASIGYTKGNWNSSQAYTLACGHQISARKQVGMFSKGLRNQTVWCEVCNSDRTVTGTLNPWENN